MKKITVDLESRIEYVLTENRITLDSGFVKLPGSTLPIALGHSGSRSSRSPLVLQWNGYDAVFVYELTRELFVH